MKTYHNHRAEPYFTFVKEGKKTIEMRLQKGKYNIIRPGDHIIVYDEEETDNLEVEVLRLARYRTFKDLLATEEMQKVLPDAKNLEQALEIPYRFYTKEQEKEFGVLAIEIRLLNS